MTDWEQIRRAYHVQEKSINEIMRETGHTFRTIKKMVESDQPPRYRTKHLAILKSLTPGLGTAAKAQISG